jgi:hypothetical protein
VNFYHGFDQPKILGQAGMRLEFEHGDITLYGWIPVKIESARTVSEEIIEKGL